MVAEGVGGCFTPKFRTCPAGSQPLAGLKPERRHLKAIMHPLAFEPIEELGARAEYRGARSAPFPLLTLIPKRPILRLSYTTGLGLLKKIEDVREARHP